MLGVTDQEFDQEFSAVVLQVEDSTAAKFGTSSYQANRQHLGQTSDDKPLGGPADPLGAVPKRL